MTPPGWTRAALGEVAHISSGGTPSRNEPRYWGGTIPWVTTGEIQFNTISQTAETITPEGLRHSSAKVFPAGTLLMAMYGQGKTRGQVARLGVDAATNQACAAIQVRSPHDHDYIYQVLASQYEAIRALGNAGTQQNLNAGLVKSIGIPLPPAHEQVRIAQMAGDWDAAIATTQRLAANSQQRRQQLMQVLLSGRRRVAGAGARWTSCAFGSVFERIRDKNTEGLRNVLTISGQHGLIDQRDFFNKHVASENLATYTVLRRAEFAYNKSTSAGYPLGAIKPLLGCDAGVVSSLYICFRIRADVRADGDFFRHYFEAGLLNKAIAGIAQEGARSHGLLNVSVADFFQLPMQLPAYEEQRRIAEIINAAEAEALATIRQVERLREEKRALMADLLSGRRRVRTAGAAA